MSLVNLNGDGMGWLAPPPTGATSAVLEGGGWVGGLVDSSEGNVLHAYQMKTTGPYEQQVIVRHAAVTGFEQPHGATMVSASLQDVPLTESLTLDFRGSEFAAQGPAIGPNGGAPSVWLAVMTGPGASHGPAIVNPRGRGWPDVALWLLTVTPPWGSAPDVALSSVPYGNPLPAAWGSFVTASQTTAPTYPAGSQNVWAQGFVSVTMPLAEAIAAPVRPGVTPVQNLRIAGQDAFGTLSGTGLLPTITWDPPALGTPNAYRITVLSGGPCTHATDWGCVPNATVVTTETSIVMPPGVLAAGAQYQVVVTAEVSPVDVTTQPFRFGPSLASADAVSNLAMP